MPPNRKQRWLLAISWGVVVMNLAMIHIEHQSLMDFWPAVALGVVIYLICDYLVVQGFDEDGEPLDQSSS